HRRTGRDHRYIREIALDAATCHICASPAHRKHDHVASRQRRAQCCRNSLTTREDTTPVSLLTHHNVPGWLTRGPRRPGLAAAYVVRNRAVRPAPTCLAGHLQVIRNAFQAPYTCDKMRELLRI